MQPLRRALCAAALLAAAGVRAAAPSTAPAQRRVALVIGNSAYRVGPLKNPVADAGAMATALRGLGFEVTLAQDTSLRDLIEAFRRFSLDTRGAAVRLLFYAGHGVQVKGRNYLLPVDTEIRAEDEVPAKSADLNELLDRLGTLQQGINIVILDACRNNPFSGAEILGPDGRRLKFRGATPAGLAPVEAPLGSMVAFSTAPGGVALDNPREPNSLYTKHLLSALQAPGLPIELLFKQVRLSVARETGRVQVPWESSSLTGDFCFKPGPGGGCTVVR
ncbi:caspase family protein [Azohydromonas caseinilytica]|uniref:Caspase family protein n=1 Tax=Azohydromonas caseinilytica TaxID=2728836 RepID=A0A848F4R9_9BURK|nr:caspase family protein [Azohydromonas caseinilytica]NML13616.1 caspase family protein [Azohydromonas caseinilytica]